MQDKIESNNEIEIIPCPIHPSLTRPILLAGADRILVLLNVTCIVMLIFGVGLHWITVIASLFLALVGHAVLIRVAKYDADFSKVYLRHLRFKTFYSAQSAVFSRCQVPRS